MAKPYRLETLALHAGQSVDATCSRAIPVCRTSAYLFRDSKHAQDLFGLAELGNIYTRLMNPTHDVLEQRVAALEGGVAAVTLASGTAAIFYTAINVARAGDEIVSASNLYGGTYTQFDNILPKMGIKTRFVDVNDAAQIESAINDKTRLLFIESIGNPGLDVANFELWSSMSKKYNIPLAVDSTFTTPYLCKPIEHGAHIVIHSLTKWMGGHGTALGGVVVDSGTFNWKDPKFTQFTEPDGSYHDLRWAHDLPAPLAPAAFALRMRLVPLRNLGACNSPDNAWIVLQGIETLGLRMQRHCDNALAVAKWLSKNPDVAWVRYPGLESDPANSNAKKFLKNGFGGMVVFGIKGGAEAGRKFIESLKLFSHVANVGDAKSLAIHPATTTHSQLSPEQQEAAGVSPDLVRLSVGIEHIDDILEDLTQGLAAAKG